MPIVRGGKAVGGLSGRIAVVAMAMASGNTSYERQCAYWMEVVARDARPHPYHPEQCSAREIPSRSTPWSTSKSVYHTGDTLLNTLATQPEPAAGCPKSLRSYKFYGGMVKEQTPPDSPRPQPQFVDASATLLPTSRTLVASNNDACPVVNVSSRHDWCEGGPALPTPFGLAAVGNMDITRHKTSRTPRRGTDFSGSPRRLQTPREVCTLVAPSSSTSHAYAAASANGTAWCGGGPALPTPFSLASAGGLELSPRKTPRTPRRGQPCTDFPASPRNIFGTPRGRGTSAILASIRSGGPDVFE